MNEDILSLILQAEKEYHGSVKKAVAEAEAYAEDCIEKHNAYINELKQDWERFEKAENRELKKRLLEAEQKMERETAQMKERLKACQGKKADIISERLKKEVLSLYGNC